MDQIAAQWPLLAGFLAIVGALLRVIQSLYERWLTEVREERDEWRELALSGTHIADTMTSVVEQAARKRP